MEPDDQELIKKILDHYKWQSAYDDTIDVQTMSGQSYKVVTTPSGYRHVDLSSVSTRDLLNECYRRRAIEKFYYATNIDSYMLQEHPESAEYAKKELVSGIVDTMYRDNKFAPNALMITEQQSYSSRYTEFRGELYICKHPTKVKK